MRNQKSVILFILMIGIMSVSLFGEEVGGHHFDWAGFLGKLLNSSVLFGVLIYFFRKPLIDFLSKKSIEIREDIVLRETELREHTNSLQAMKERLGKIESEVTEMIAAARKTGEDEAIRIEELAKIESERIIKNSSEEIEARIESSIIELKKRIADMTIEEFRANYRSILDRDLHKKIIDKNIEISGEIIEKG